MPGTKIALPMMNGQAGNYLRVNMTETDYEWASIVAGQAYRTIQGNAVSAVQRSIMNFSTLFTVSDNIPNVRTDITINVTNLANSSTFVAALIANSTFTSGLATSSAFITSITSNTTFLQNIANSSTFVNTLIANSTFITNLSSNSTFVNNIANNSTFINTLANNSTFITDLSTNSTFINSVTNIVTTGGGVLFQTDGTDNGSQAKLNLVAGTNMTLTDDGSGNVTLDAAGGGGSGNALTDSVHQVSHGFSVGNLIKSNGLNNEFDLAVGDNAADAEVVGIVTVVTSGSDFTYSQDYMKYVGAGIPSGTPGEGVFLDQSIPGAMTLTPDTTTTGLVVKAVGVLTASSGGAMNFSSSYLGLINP